MIGAGMLVLLSGAPLDELELELELLLDEPPAPTRSSSPHAAAESIAAKAKPMSDMPRFHARPIAAPPRRNSRESWILLESWGAHHSTR